jgi:uncharacterized GH25 family protein
MTDGKHGLGGGNDALKRAWPEWVGKSGIQAKAAILLENSVTCNEHGVPNAMVNVELVNSDTRIVTADYCPARIRIFVDSNGTVVRVPTRG